MEDNLCGVLIGVTAAGAGFQFAVAAVAADKRFNPLLCRGIFHVKTGRESN